MEQRENLVGPPPQSRLLDKSKLIVDLAYQRKLSERKSVQIVSKISANFSWRMFGAIIVADNDDGTYSVIDGQHRVAASMRREDVSQVPCLVVDADTLKEQASTFVGINKNRVNVNAVAMFHAQRIARDQSAVEIDEVLTAANCSVPRYQKSHSSLAPGELNAIGAVRGVINKYGKEIAITAMKTLRAAYSESGGDLRSQLIRAMGDLLHMEAYQGKKEPVRKIDHTRLINTIASKDADGWIQSARVMSGHLGNGNVTASVRYLIVAAYNSGLHATNKLPWDR
jgi:hypothetical protein